MDLREIIHELKKPFAIADHKDRKLPGGGRWFYIPWQKIRDRLDEACPEWSVSYSDPVITGDLVVIRCQLCLAGVMREGVGNSDTDKGYGTPIERAVADAFKNAAEAFGVGRYLDDQEFVVRYMKSKGDGRAAQYSLQNGVAPAASPTPLGREGLMQAIRQEVNRLGWNEEQSREALATVCQGKRSRQDCSNNELSQFLGYLKTQTVVGVSHN